MRLDTNNPVTLRKIRELGLKAKLIRWLNSDAPIDVCAQDYWDNGFTDDVAHPPYDQDHYSCFICGCVLELQDDSRVAGV